MNLKDNLRKCLRENNEKCKTFSVPIKKEVAKVDKEGN